MPMARRVQTATLDTGVTLPYVEQGDGSGIPVLFLHGYADSWRFFGPLLEHLAPTLRALVPTQRGHGDAERPRHGYRPVDFAADAAAFLDAAGVRSAVVVGQSSGGYTAQRLALDRPERVLGLVLLGSPRDFRDKPGLAEIRRAVSRLEDPVDPAFVREFVAGTAGTLPPELLEVLVDESRKVPAHVWQATLEGLVGAEVPVEAGEITSPALLIRGDRDTLVTRSEQLALASAIPGAKLLVYPGAGHSIACERPRRCASDVAAFARSLARRPDAPVTPESGATPYDTPL